MISDCGAHLHSLVEVMVGLEFGGGGGDEWWLWRSLTFHNGGDCGAGIRVVVMMVVMTVALSLNTVIR